MSSSSLSSRFFSFPARFAGRCVARVHRATHSVWVWRAPRAGDRPSPACIFFPCRDQYSASALAQLARVRGLRATVKAADACAVFCAGPLAGRAHGPVCKVEIPPHLAAADVRDLLSLPWGNDYLSAAA